MSNSKIIIVEDDVILSRLFQINLKKAGYKIIGSFSNGRDAFDFIQAGNIPNLILMDIIIEGHIDGIETAELIQLHHDIPIIFLSGLSDEDIVERVTRAHAYSYLIKPIDPQQLLFTIKIVLKNHSVETRLKESRAWFSRTLETIKDAVITLDSDLKIQYFNESAVNLSGDDTPLKKDQPLIDQIKIIDSQSNKDITNLLCSDEYSEQLSNNDHIELVRKNHANTPIEFISSPITDNNISYGRICIFRDVTDKRARLQSIETYKNQLQIFSDHLRNIQETERTNIAQQIHDELGQYLARIKMDLSRLRKKSDPLLSIDFEETEHVADELIKRVRKVASELRPRILDDGNLAEALEWLIGEYQKNIPVTCSIDISSEDISIDISTDIFRIVQESMTNILKHSDASKVTIRIKEEDNFIYLTIADDGVGFEIKDLKDTRTMGVLGMQERARRVQGDFNISSDQNGTIVSAKIPLIDVDINS